MAAFSDYFESLILNHWLRNTAFTSPTSTWLALFTATDGLETNAPTAEVTGGAYARLEIGGATGRSYTAPVNGLTTNGQAWEFPQASASWGIISHVAAMSALTGGNVFAHTALTTPTSIGAGDIARFNSGIITITLQ